MFKAKAAFSGFSVTDIKKAQKFYTETLGLKVDDNGMGLQLHLPESGKVFIYEKDNHQPASFTILNFVVEDIDKAADVLIKQGVTFEQYEGFHQDKKRIARGIAANMGPDIAWFKDPAGNILSILQNE